MLALLLTWALLQGNIDVPANDGWVTDGAGLLTAEQETSLEALMESYRVGTTHEIALLTVPDLGGQPIERFALEVGRTWKMGTAEENNAALLVIAREERKIRIEVARGLEGALPDAMAWRIIDQVISPEFKRGNFYGGIRSGVEAMHSVIGGDYGVLERSPNSRSVRLIGIVPFLFGAIMLIGALSGSRRRHGRGTGPIILGSMLGGHGRGGFSGGFGGGFGSGGGGGGFSGFGGGGGFSGGGSSGGW